MPSRYLGLVVGERTGRAYSVVNAEKDEELDHASHLGLEVENPEPLKMVRWERAGRNEFSTYENLADIIAEYYVRTCYKPDEPPYEGPETLEP